MFHRLHDLDDNIKLDGLEILQAIMHTEHHDAHDHEEQDGSNEMDNADEQDAMQFGYYIGKCNANNSVYIIGAGCIINTLIANYPF